MKKLSSRQLVIGGIIFLIIPYLFWLFLGENSYVLIHDCLDHEFVFIQQLLKSGNLFGFDLNGQIEGVMHGIPRNFYRSGFNVIFLIFRFLPPFEAYVVHHLVVHLIGFIGMFFLLKRYFLQNKKLYVLGISLCFGMLSYYHIQYGISIAGQPILLYAFLNLLNNDKKAYNWIIILFFPFFSFLPITLPFFLPFLVIIGFYSYYQKKIFPFHFTLGIVLLCALNILVEFNLIYSILFSDIESHRTEWDKIFLSGGLPAFKDFILTIYNGIKFTHYHAGSLSAIPTAFAVLLFYWQRKNSIILKFILAILLFNFIWYDLSDYLTHSLKEKISFFNTFNIKRFYYLSPFLWLLALSITIDKMVFTNWLTKKIPMVLIFLSVISALLANDEFKKNVAILIQDKKSNDFPSFSQFYDNRLFETIKNDLELKDEKLKSKFICVGMFPNIAQYNGFNTLDSYQNNYPLAYKKGFRKIIFKELEKNNKIKNYFDFWGSRCYAFSAEIGKKYIFSKTNDQTINRLEYNWDQFKKMNGKYILSSIEINTIGQSRLKFHRMYTSEESFWKIYLYEVKD